MHVIEYLRTNTLQDMCLEFGITPKWYGDRVMLNYHMINSHPFKHHPIVCECRGLILGLGPKAVVSNFTRESNDPRMKKRNLPVFVMSRAFDRFFNYNEDLRTAEFNIALATAYEKLDGSLIEIYHDAEKWCAATRGNAFCESTSQYGGRHLFIDLVLRAIGRSLEEEFKNANKKYTYIYELTTPENRVVKPYEDYRITLTGIRVKETGEYIYDDEAYEKYHLPKTYTFTNIDDLHRNIKELPTFDEGYVCRIGDWRIKVKAPNYLHMAHLSNNGVFSEHRIIMLVLAGEEDEIISNFPENKAAFQPFIDARDKMIRTIDDEWEKYKDIENQKDFALAIVKSPVNHILLSMKLGRTVESVFERMTNPAKERLINLFVKRG